MDPREYLVEAKQRFCPLPDDALAGLSEQQIASMRDIESSQIAISFARLSEVILNCTNKYQFAKTYRVLREDLRKTLTQIDTASQPANEKRVMKALLERVENQMLREMAGWFYIHFADASDLRQVEKIGGRIESAIEVYAGKEGGSGCLVTIVVLVGGGTASIVYPFLA